MVAAHYLEESRLRDWQELPDQMLYILNCKAPELYVRVEKRASDAWQTWQHTVCMHSPQFVATISCYSLLESVYCVPKVDSCEKKLGSREKCALREAQNDALPCQKLDRLVQDRHQLADDLHRLKPGVCFCRTRLAVMPRTLRIDQMHQCLHDVHCCVHRAEHNMLESSFQRDKHLATGQRVQGQQVVATCQHDNSRIPILRLFRDIFQIQHEFVRGTAARSAGRAPAPGGMSWRCRGPASPTWLCLGEGFMEACLAWAAHKLEAGRGLKDSGRCGAESADVACGLQVV